MASLATTFSNLLSAQGEEPIFFRTEFGRGEILMVRVMKASDKRGARINVLIEVFSFDPRRDSIPQNYLREMGSSWWPLDDLSPNIEELSRKGPINLTKSQLGHWSQCFGFKNLLPDFSLARSGIVPLAITDSSVHELCALICGVELGADPNCVNSLASWFRPLKELGIGLGVAPSDLTVTSKDWSYLRNPRPPRLGVPFEVESQPRGSLVPFTVETEAEAEIFFAFIARFFDRSGVANTKELGRLLHQSLAHKKNKLVVSDLDNEIHASFNYSNRDIRSA